VGVAYAKSLAFALGKPLIAVNHLEGHIHAVLLAQRRMLDRMPLSADPWPWWFPAATPIFI
jgi:N6-L-threonylcarbamoyladenine synthase